MIVYSKTPQNHHAAVLGSFMIVIQRQFARHNNIYYSLAAFCAYGISSSSSCRIFFFPKEIFSPLLTTRQGTLIT